MSGANFNETTLKPETGLTRDQGWFQNLAIVRATTTNAGDSVKITSANGTALSAQNPGFINLMDPSNPGQTVPFTVTSDVTILLTGLTYGFDTYGDILGVLARILAINDNGTLKWGVAYVGGRHTLLTTDTTDDPASVNLPEEVLCNVAVASATNSCRELGFIRADFDDTGGAAENLWAIQTGPNDVVTGQTADGVWQQCPGEDGAASSIFAGFSSNPSLESYRWSQVGREIYVKLQVDTVGTSNATTLTVQSPVKAGFTQESLWSEGMDNTVALTTPGRVDTTIGSKTLVVYKDTAAGAWTNSGSKYVQFNIAFEVGPVASFIE